MAVDGDAAVSRRGDNWLKVMAWRAEDVPDRVEVCVHAKDGRFPNGLPLTTVRTLHDKTIPGSEIVDWDGQCEDWSHCLYRRSLKSVNWHILVQSEDHKRIFSPRMMNYAKIPYDSTIHPFRGSSTRSSLYCGLAAREKKRKKLYRRWTHSYRRKSNMSSTMGGVQFVPTTMPAKQK